MRKSTTVIRLLLGLAVAWSMPWSPNHSLGQQPDRTLVQIDAKRADSARRVALVIGNGAYTSAPHLKNPPNDARDMAATLKQLGFTVASAIDADQRTMKRLIREFGQQLKSGGQGLFYYAGHGVQMHGRNYLIPANAEITSETDVEDQGVDLSLVLGLMDEAENGLNIVILDACRNNPFARSFRSAGSGLAQVDAPTGTLIAYATSPGRVASDGQGRNGLYTSELLSQMRVTGIGVEEMFKRVRAGVQRQTSGQQVPWESSSLVGDFYFAAPTLSASTKNANNNGAGEEAVNRMVLDPTAFELSYWDSIKSSTNPDDFKAYLEKYPNGQFATLANNRIKNLEVVTKRAESELTSRNTDPGELAFWEAVKGSTNADDFRAYLKRFPNGTFADLATNRLKILDKDEDANRAATEITKRTKSFAGSYGLWGSIKGGVFVGRLVVSPGKIEFTPEDKSAFIDGTKIKKGWFKNSPEGNAPLNCSQFVKATVDETFIREIGCGPEDEQKCRFNAESDAEAASALAAIREVCKPSAQVDPTSGSPADSLEGTTWRGASPGGDKQYEFQFLPGGVYRGQAIVGKYVFRDSGTWKHVGNRVSIDSVVEGFPETSHSEATIEQDTMKGSSVGGKYKFIMRKIQ